MPTLLTIGEVAKQAGIRASAIRFYEKVGLLPEPIRASGQRRYSASVLARLAFLRRTRECGFTLKEVRDLLNDCGRPSERWQRAARKKIAELDALAERLAGMRDLLQRRCDCADLDECGRRILKAKSNNCSA
jgi:DNA-binding transcriptional MerR regulator